MTRSQRDVIVSDWLQVVDRRRLWSERIHTLQDLLLLVQVKVSLKELDTWTIWQLADAELWAIKVHLYASDNPVRVPPVPEHLRGHGGETDNLAPTGNPSPGGIPAKITGRRVVEGTAATSPTRATGRNRATGEPSTALGKALEHRPRTHTAAELITIPPRAPLGPLDLVPRVDGPYRRHQRPLWLRIGLACWHFLRDFPANAAQALIDGQKSHGDGWL